MKTGSTSSGGGFSDAGGAFVHDTKTRQYYSLPLPKRAQPLHRDKYEAAGEGRAFFDASHASRAQGRIVPSLENGYCLLGPELSARQIFSPAQSVFFLLLAGVSLAMFLFQSQIAIIAASVVFSSFYVCVVLFRLGVLANFHRPPSPAHLRRTQSGERYIILVALYREALQVEPLVRGLDGLRWQAGAKEVHLICEEDDLETIAAIAALKRTDINLTVVPSGKPRTKPRALNHVLWQVEGDYLVLYDAEDRPHPDQLLEAAAAFRSGSANLACLQAPLSIDNRNESLITRFFAIEYETLFRGILPALAKWKAPIPLGGTSNHFRLPLLTAAGGWDSFNVTEDADLGIRLARCGLYCETLTLPTHEEAPAAFGAWMRQRTRWIKGWLQTLLVHLRDPAQTAREMGWIRFLQFQMVLTAVVVSVLVHPFFLAAFAYQMAAYISAVPSGAYEIWITGVSAFNLAAGYLSYGLLAWAVQESRGNRGDKTAILVFPLYWLMISLAGWLALWQLLRRPHHWSKTDHGSTARNTPTHKAPISAD